MRKNDDPDINERAGSESLEDLVDPGQHVRYEGTIVDGPIGNWLAGAPKAKQLVSAPVLVSTIDYLMPATEGTRGGRQIAPMLRLLSSDLVLDEPDDFALEDLPALCRLVNWAGMLGSRVLLSSATLAPALVHALFAAYLEGRRLFDASKARQASTRVSCAWFDEFGATHSIHDRPSTFSEAHSGFVSVRIRYLKKQLLPLRRARLQTIDSSSQAKEDVTAAFAQVCHEQLYELHTCHATASLLDPQKTVSFGLIRMANIEPLIDVAKLLLSKAPPQRHRLHFCVYHSQYPLILRSNIESTLDRVLNRTSPDAIWDAPTVKNALLKYPEDHHVFVVLGTSVTEVGRDHDYDWAIVEPSSMRSLVQLAGRIQRHRQQVPEHANLAILTRNVKGLSGAPVAFTRPGFESKDFCLASKDLRNILLSEQFTQLNAVPRISPRSELDYRNNLVDLEHVHLQARLFGGSGTPFNASLWWEHESSWCGELQRRTPFRRSTPDEEFVLYREDETDEFTFVQVLPNSGQLQNVQLSRFANYELTINERVSPWINQDVPELIEGLSETTGWSHANCCLRFASVRLREGGRWRFSPQLGIHSMP